MLWRKYLPSGKSHFPYYLIWVLTQKIVPLSQVINIMPIYKTQEGTESIGGIRDVKIIWLKSHQESSQVLGGKWNVIETEKSPLNDKNNWITVNIFIICLTIPVYLIFLDVLNNCVKIESEGFFKIVMQILYGTLFFLTHIIILLPNIMEKVTPIIIEYR